MELTEVSESIFTNDLLTYAKNKENPQHNLEIWKNALLARNLKINVEKTKVMVIGKKERVNKTKRCWN